MAYLDEYDSRNALRNKSNLNSKRRVAASIRVSTEHEEQINALGNQKDWIKELVRKHNDWIFDEKKDLYIESGKSGTTRKNRPEFERMIKKAKEGKYDLLVFREISRCLRNTKETLILVDELKEKNCEVYFAQEDLYTYNSEDYFRLTIMAQQAEMESRKISERVHAGQAMARKKGVIFGNGNILGYDLKEDFDKGLSYYVINQEQCNTVKLIFELYLKGYGCKKIRQYLEDNGYKTSSGKNQWFDSTIQRILKRRTYIGEYQANQSVTKDPLTHKRERGHSDTPLYIETKIPIPPIIDRDTWEAVQKEMAERSCRTFKKNGESITVGAAKNKDVYCRKMRCGCGRKFKKDEDTKNHTVTYRCYQLVDDRNVEQRLKRSEALEDNCCIYGIRDWKMDLFTSMVFSNLKLNIGEIKKTVMSVVDECFVFTEEEFDIEAERIRLEKELKRIKDKNETLLDMREDGEITKEKYWERKNKNDTKIAEINSKLDSINAKDPKTINEEKKQAKKNISVFLNQILKMPDVGSGESVSEILIDTYVNSIKACADNEYEYNIRINPEAEVDIPVIPDEKFNPQIHSARKVIDNSKSVLIDEFEIGYEEAKAYASKRNGKAIKAQWKKPAHIKVYVDFA